MSTFSTHRVDGTSIKTVITILTTNTIVLSLEYQTQDWRSNMYPKFDPVFESHLMSLHINVTNFTEEELQQQLDTLKMQFPNAEVSDQRNN